MVEIRVLVRQYARLREDQDSPGGK